MQGGRQSESMRDALSMQGGRHSACNEGGCTQKGEHTGERRGKER